MAFPRDVNDVKEIKINLKPILAIAPLLVAALAAVSALGTSWTTIGPEEQGVVVRFGKYNRTLQPGLHFKWPWGMERVTNVPVTKVLKAEFGFQTLQPGINTQYASDINEQNSLMLTGDLNVAHLEWVTQFKISNPRDFLFKVRNVPGTFSDMNEAVMREIIGDRSINEVLTFGRQAIEFEMQTRLKSLCDQYELGITVESVILQAVSPPKLVQAAFNEVNKAQQERETLINQAQQEYNKVIPRAKGESAKIIEEARGYAVERVNRAKGEAERFTAMFDVYQSAPEVTQQRIYLETMNKVLGQVGRKIIIDESAKGILPLLNLNEGAKTP